jgi:cytochrome c biogenesis protein CcdA
MIKIHIAETENVGLLQEYFEAYEIPSDKRNVPILFSGSNYYVGYEEIQKGLSDIVQKLEEGKFEQLKLIEGTSVGADILKTSFDTFKAFNVFLIGLVNGLNPCSLSMLLFLLSLVVARQDIKVLRIGISFIIGKFLTYILIGTLLHGFFSEIQMNRYNILLKSTLGLFVLIMAYLNIRDYFNAKNERYTEIKNQLPSGIKKLNHQIISNIVSKNSGIILVIAGGVLGIIVSVGEFLCTGQVYLATMLYILRDVRDDKKKIARYKASYGYCFADNGAHNNIVYIVPLCFTFISFCLSSFSILRSSASAC